MFGKIHSTLRPAGVGRALWSIVGLACGLSDGLASDRWSALREYPPFGEQPAVEARTASEWELRGWVVEGGNPLFNLYHWSDRRSCWAGLGEATPCGTVVAWYPERAIILIQQAGRNLPLTLKQARLVLAVTVAAPTDAEAPKIEDAGFGATVEQRRDRAQQVALFALQQRRTRRELVEAFDALYPAETSASRAATRNSLEDSFEVSERSSPPSG